MPTKTKGLSELNRPTSERFLLALAHVKHFSDLPADVKEALANLAALHRFPAGQIIYLEGEPADALYLLESGWVKATRIPPDGREQAMLFLKAGEIFDDIAVFTGTPYPATVTALEDVNTWAIQQQAMVDLVSRYPAMGLAIIRRFGERVLHYVEMVEDLSLRSVEARLAGNLLKHAEQVGEQLIVPRRTWTTFDEMAVRLGTVRDVLARALHALEQDGYLRVEKHAIIILDQQGLLLRSNS